MVAPDLPVHLLQELTSKFLISVRLMVVAFIQPPFNQADAYDAYPTLVTRAAL